MKKLLTTLFALIVLSTTIAQNWIPVGGLNPFPGTADHDFTILDNNRPAVAYSMDGSNQLDVQLWNGSSWEILPQITPLSVTEVQISHIGNTIVVGFFENLTEYVLYQYVGGSWSQLGDIGITTEFYSGAHLIQGANPGELWFSFINQSFNAFVKKWNGLAWSNHGADFIPATPNLINGELGSDGNKVYYLSNDQNFPDSWLYTANEAVSGFSQYGSNSVANDINLISLDCSPSKIPSIGYVDNLSQGTINFVRPDGVGDFTVDEVINTGPAPVLNFDHAMGADDSLFVVYTDNNGATFVTHQEGGTMFQYGGDLTLNNPSETDIEIFKNSGKPYVLLKEDIISYVMTFNHAPAYSTDAGALQICQDATNATYLSSITFTDQDFDSVYVSAVSNSPGLITTGNVIITRTNPYSSGSNQNIFSINVTPQAGQSGIANIDLYVTDGLETFIYPINVTVNGSPTFSQTTTNTTCNALCDGQINITVTTGTAPYTYSSNNGSTFQSGSSFTGLCAGNYDLIVLDANGCQSAAVTETITEPTALSYVPSIINNTCNGSCDGQIDLFAFGGTSPYQYSNNNGSTFQAGSTFSGLCAGSYDMIVQDVNGCQTATVTEIVTEPSAITYAPTLINPTCNGLCDGQIDLTASGGTTPYTYSSNNGSTYQAGNSFTGLCAGNYDIIIQDANACLSTPTVETLIEPTVVVATAPGDLTLCDGDAATLNGVGSGGTPPLVYTWDQSVTDGVAFTPALGTLTYTLTVTDNNGCIATDGVDITVNSLPNIVAGLDISACDGDLITLNGSGGISYVWNNSVVDGVAFTQAVGTVTYQVTGVDVNGCENTDNLDVSVFANPAVFSVTPSNPSACGVSDGSLLLTGLALSSTFDVTYNNGSVQGPFSLSTNTSGELTIPGLAAGSYSDITVTNANNCSTSDAGPYSISDPSAPSINAGADMTICEGEPVTLSGVNSENALISWNNGVLNGHTFYPIATTTYTVTASSSGCVATDNITITVNPLPDIALSILPATCGATDGSVNSSITNGTAPYSIYWSNGTTGTSINNLFPALYYINVTDANNCYAMEVATVGTSAISVSGVKNDNFCQGDQVGSIDLTVAGTGPFTYSWSNGATTEDISGLASGQYEVMITDGNGCQASASFIINSPLAMYGELVSTNATCGAADGSITSSILGGTPSYSFQWKDNLGNDLTGETASSLTNYATGAYSIVVTDQNGCTHELFSGISENNGPSVSVDSLIASSCDSDGTINVNVNSGFAITSYNWSNGAITEDQTNIGSGQYNLIVEDVNGCFGVLAVELPALLPATTDICIVSVDTSTNTNLVVWEKPITDEIAYFNIYRESSIAGMFQLVDSISYNQESAYNDTIAYPGLRSWRYRLGTVDTCGNESILSDEHKTMHVTISSTGGVYNVAWDQYEGFSYSTYFVWRHTDADGWVQIDAVPTTITTYTETPPSTDGIDYMITIQPPTVCTSTSVKATDYNSSRSNRSTSSTLGNPEDDSGVQTAEISVNVYPNPSKGIFQIKVDGINNYEVFVYDISGKLVFTSNVNNSNYNLDLTGIHPGSYMLRIQSESGIANQQLIVR